MKKCTKCKIDKPIEEFSFLKKNENIRMSECKECRSEYQKNYRKNNIQLTREKDRLRYLMNSEKRKQYAKNYRKQNPDKTRQINWKNKYNLSSKQYYEKLKRQGNKCAICGIDMNKYGKIFCVDHDHSTGKIRGLLCDPCNYGLGFYEKYKDQYNQYLKEFTL